MSWKSSFRYTSDQRFKAIHHPHSEDWILQIKYPQHRDSGIYECQISTTPHMSHFIHLSVIGEFFRSIYFDKSFVFFVVVRSEAMGSQTYFFNDYKNRQKKAPCHKMMSCQTQLAHNFLKKTSWCGRIYLCKINRKHKKYYVDLGV